MREIDTIDQSMKQINREVLSGWVAFYYENGQVVRYSSETHDWASLPNIGVMYLFRVYESGAKEQVGGCDYYCPYQLMNVADIRPWIKFGLYIDDEIFNTIVWPTVVNDPINH